MNSTQTDITHHCVPRSASPCLKCGELLPVAEFCATCGADISPTHVCKPQPLPHQCAPHPAPPKCLACGQTLPAARFCTTCGADITPSHRCSAAPPTQVPRPDPVHICPVYELPKCPHCQSLLPAMAFCPDCGLEITPPHICPSQSEPHICPPLVTMPRRCARCGDLLSAPQHCTRCGADITPAHACSRA